MNTSKLDQSVPYIVTDLPIPYRMRVVTPSPELRAFVVPRLGVQGSPFLLDEAPSEVKLRVA
jgi:hypothetical protein